MCPMQVTVRLFAAARDAAAGSDAVRLDLPAGATVADAASRLSASHAGLSDVLRHAAFARNRRYARPTEALADGDELTVLPPVSGGCTR